MASDLRRLMEISSGDRLLLARAAGALLLASLAIRLLPFRLLVSRLAGAAPESRHHQWDVPREIARSRWAIEACALRLPWRIVCFQKGLALHRLLRQRGISTILHYGVAQDAVRGLRAHVWVTYKGLAVIGGEQASGYTCLASYPNFGQR